MKELGVNSYRFSISWSRILKSDNTRNQEGIDYYTKLIDALLLNKIEPVVTLYHWDLPLIYQQEFGGWVDSQIVDQFVIYAKTCFELWGKKINYWITFNEPSVFTIEGYELGDMAPNIRDPGVSCYIIAKNVILAHGKAYRLYKDEMKLTGQVGITLNSDYNYVRNEYKAIDWIAANRGQVFYTGWWAELIYGISDDWPIFMTYATEQRRHVDRYLPEWTAKELAIVQNTSDFYGLNHYTSRYVYPLRTKFGEGDHLSLYYRDRGCLQSNDNTRENDWNWNVQNPVGLYKLLKRIHKKYNNPAILITENGNAEPASWAKEKLLRDTGRVRYLTEYLSSVSKAIDEGVNVIGYTAWSLMDNFEWSQGYDARFGLVYVDFDSEARTRTKKTSFYCYRDIIENNSIVDSENCPRDTADRWVTGPRLELYAKFYGILDVGDAEKLSDQIYTYFLRYESIEIVQIDSDGIVVKLIFINDPENSTREDGRYIYETFKTFVYETCGSVYNLHPCEAAFGLIPGDAVQLGAPTKYVFEPLHDETTTDAPATTAQPETTPENSGWKLGFSGLFVSLIFSIWQ